jgi:hypothetical protein
MSAGAVLNRTTFSTSRLLEFCSRKELVAQTGHEPEDWPLVIIKELIDNSLDSAEEAGVAPVIHVTVARDMIRVRDNGPGIPPETVASVLDFTTRTSSREAYVAPDRGRQGNALKTVVAMPFALSGEQCSDLRAVRSHFLPIVDRFAYLNPHLTIYAAWVDEKDRVRRTRRATAAEWSKWTPSAPACSHWYRRAEFERLIGAFLTHDRQQKSVRLLRDFLAEFSGLSATAKRKAILDGVGLQRAPLERLLNGGMEFDHDLVDRLLAAMQKAARPIKPDAFGALGKDTVARSFAEFGADLSTFRYKLVKSPGGGLPWVVETAFACRPGHRRILVSGLNWSPTLRIGDDPFGLGYQLGSSWCGYDEPVVILAHLICPRPEFIDRGKRCLARYAPGFDAMRDAVASITADWEKQRRAEERNQARAQKRIERMRAENRAPEASLKDLVLKHLPVVVQKISEGGRLSFTQRDVFYGVRPLVQAEHEKSLTYSYFTSLITDYENDFGEIAGMQREARGSIYHPHLRQEIPLCTETVAKYHRPFWTFNKMVYIEKAGTQQNLIETGWPEEFDCAIASVAGFTTRAIKDLVDLLAQSTEPVTVFCVHDADAAGTMIWHTLQNETKARGVRKIEVVNLGLEPWEGVEMGLEIEEAEPIERRRSVAPYVGDHDHEWRSWLNDRNCDSWSEWLQGYRIELNAMAPAQRIAWITKKIEKHPPRKVIPPHQVLHEKRLSAAREVITDELTERARIEERTDEIMKMVEWPPPERASEVTRRYLDLKRHRRASWTRPMKASGARAAKRIISKLDGKGQMP